MSCNSCAKGFSLLRQEKGCPGCGFSFCSKCLNNKVFLSKLNCEAKVCAKCEKKSKQKNESQIIPPPDAYYKRLAATEAKSAENTSSNHGVPNVDDHIQARLNKLKEDSTKMSSDEEIAKRLQGIKGSTHSTTNAAIQDRLAKLRGTPVIVTVPKIPVRDLRTEQEQADDLIKQYVEQTQIDTKYKDEFDSLIGDIETRMQKLKGPNNPSAEAAGTSQGPRIASNASTLIVEPGSADSHVKKEEEEAENVIKEFIEFTQKDYKDVYRRFIHKLDRLKAAENSKLPSVNSLRKIIEEVNAEASLDEIEIATLDELPFCEICNDDATMRCLGCKYLFCKRCFLDHKDDDDGCNSYEPYQPPKQTNRY